MSKKLVDRKLYSEYEPWNKIWYVTDDNYDGAPDSNCPVGTGSTEVEAIINYWETKL